ncbi:MAG: right-handed parallel beta-helix repeat-containing protein [Sedimentisphaerales bacterium]
MAVGTNRIITILVSVFVLVTTAPTFAGNIIYVDADAPGGNDGSSWADAYNYLQDALADANFNSDVNEIRVAQGIYKPDLGVGITPGDREATFQLINGVALKGGFAGFGQPDPNHRDIELCETTLTGDLNGDDIPIANPKDLWDEPTWAENSYHVVTGSGTDATAVLDGFIITGGNAGGPYPHFNGGGMYNSSGSPTLRNCTIRENFSLGSGAGIRSGTPGGPILYSCRLIRNLSGDGYGGGISSNKPTLVNCTVSGNSAFRNGGGVECDGGLMINCLFNGNRSEHNGGGMSFADCTPGPTLINCTFSSNTAGDMGGGIYMPDSGVSLLNCILWGNSDINGIYESSQIYANEPIVVNYSCIQGWTGYIGGTGNIGSDPLFVDADGIDNIVGTDDDNLRLLVGSPCIDAGDNSVVTVTTDLDDNPRIMGNAVDMGAYEASTIYHVDGATGDNTNDGLTRETAFATIQRGINAADDYETVLVWPGVYNDEIVFWGDAITVKSAADAAVVEVDYGYAFSFFSAEGPNTVLSNFIIRNSQYGIYLVNGASPTLRNLTIVNNDFGISAFNGADPDISNCIFWDNIDGDLFREPVPLQARYSCIEEGGEGEGNISVEPGFVDANGGDYHLLSERGRYWLAHDVWVLDEVTSSCVDGGDPAVEPSNERMPNGGRINMGAYGNSAYASMSECWSKADFNCDGIVDFKDFAVMAAGWLDKAAWIE